MRKVPTMAPSQMGEWKSICRCFAEKVNAKLLFVNETSCGVEFEDGTLKHIYIEEMAEYLNKGEQMPKLSYKDARQISLGMSDIASLTLRAPDKAEILKFGGDSAYTAYFLDEDAAEYEIGEHYAEVFSCENWLKTYDDDMLTNKIYAKTIKIYRAGDYGCIIAASGIDYANTLLETI